MTVSNSQKKTINFLPSKYTNKPTTMKIHFHITYPIQYGQQKYQIFFVSLPSTASQQDQTIFRLTKKHIFY